MKKTLYSFSGQSELETVPLLSTYLDSFEIVPYQNLSAAEVLERNFDFVELKANEYDQFKTHIPAVGWKVNQLSTADILVRDKKIYRPSNIIADCILHLIQQRQMPISTSEPVMVIGEYHFVLSVTAKLALAGFDRFIISFENEETFSLLKKRLNAFIFNLKLNFVKLNELNQVSIASSMLISNVTEEMSPGAYESLAYFNFLSRGGVFVDANSEKNASLIEEARRAELDLIQEIEILTLKYKTLLDLFKISPKV